jgi:protein-S-isoprenylcysteine O-methyltransferase Ste14
VGISVVSGFQSQSTRVPVHLLDEVLYRLVRSHPTLVVLLCVLVGISVGRLGIRILSVLLLLLIILLLLLFVVLVSSGDLEQILPKMLSQTCCCIITTGQHKCVQQIVN